MPNLYDHKKHSLRELGVDGAEVHEWMDSYFAKIRNRKHRAFNHNFEKACVDIQKEQPQIVEKLGLSLVKALIADHIQADFNEYRVPQILIYHRSPEKMGLL